MNDKSNNNPTQQSWAYSKKVQEHFFNPHNLMHDDKGYEYDGKGKVGNPVCGDEMIVWIKVDSKTKKIKECKWRTFGCAAAISATSIMSVMVTENGGMDIEEAKKLKPEDIIDRLTGLPNRKAHCSVLGASALRSAIDDYLKNKK